MKPCLEEKRCNNREEGQSMMQRLFRDLRSHPVKTLSHLRCFVGHRD